MNRVLLFLFWTIFASLCGPYSAAAFSVLSHEAVIDASWDQTIQPLLLKRFPGATPDQLKEARSYAYGGAVVPDMGYFPTGNRLFTDLLHYVRTGDFVTNLFDEAGNLDELAFALGVMAHYYADNYGHPMAVNRSVPIMYPRMRRKYGDVVTYCQNQTDHVRMEFGFDVLQTARGDYASQHYHDFIGFNVAVPLLQRAFLKTYGLEIKDLFVNLPVSVATFRWSVKKLFPVITRTAWVLRQSQIKKSNPGITAHNFKYKMRRSDYNHEFGRERPSVFAYLLSLPIRFVPKRVILRSFRFKAPGERAEKLFVQSFDSVQVHYVQGMEHVRSGHYQFRDLDFDTGRETAKGEYPLADKTFNKFLIKLQKKGFARLTPGLKQNILAFYSRSPKESLAHPNSDETGRLGKALMELRGRTPSGQAD